jgi:predicted GH43/DUF377 family glycosyl hydrolase
MTVNQITFDNRTLIPQTWARERPVEQYYVTNPTIQFVNERWIMAYKIVTPSYHSERFAICRLDAALCVVPESVVPLSDSIPNSTTQVGDPRLFLYQERLFVIYCHFRLPSLLYIAEIDPDSLNAVGPARPLLLDDRRWQEKNWMPFEHEGELLAVYSIAPHVILQLDLSDREVIACRRIHRSDWDVSHYHRHFGEPRGGAPPVRIGNVYYSFFQSHYFTSRLHRRIAPFWYALRARLGRPEHWQGPRLAGGDVRPLQATTDWVYHPRRLPFRLGGMLRLYEQYLTRRRYVAGFYAFTAMPPFVPVLLHPRPVLRPEPEDPPRRKDRLSPLNEQVVYTCGAAHLNEQSWLITYGVHDERCALRRLNHAQIINGCEPTRIGEVV